MFLVNAAKLDEKRLDCMTIVWSMVDVNAHFGCTGGCDEWWLHLTGVSFAM